MQKKHTNKSLLIPGDFPPVISGIATYFYEIWKFYPPENSYILASKDESWEDFDSNSKMNIIRKKIPTSDSGAAKIFKGLLYAFWSVILQIKYKFDVIHCGQVLSSGFSGWLLKKLFGVPYIIYVYGSETFRFGNNWLLKSLITIFLQNAKKIIPNSRFTMEEFLSLGIAENRFEIVTPGVDINRFTPENKNNALVEKYHLKNKTVFLTVARLDERKGHDKILEALSKLARINSDFIYLIVGKGREEKRLKELTIKYGIEDQVVFSGFISDELLPDYYNLCDIFILLNRQTADDPRLSGDYEGFGIVFLEASACAKPVIAGDFGGIADAVDEGKSGYIIDGTNLTVITQLLEKLIKSSKLGEQLGNYGRQRAEELFTWELKSKEIEAIL